MATPPQGSKTSTAALAATIIALLAVTSVVVFNLSSTYDITPFWQIGITPNSSPTSYYAKAPNGTISWTSTNPAFVINNCTEIANTSTFLSNGLYPLQGYTILMANDTSLTGQSWQAILQISPNSGYTANAIQNLAMNTNIPNFNITIRNLQIDGNVANQNATSSNHQKAIEFVNVTNGLVDHVYAHDTSYDLMGAWQGSKNCIFQYNTVKNSIYKNGIFIEASSTGNVDPTYREYSNKVLFNHIMNAGYCGVIGGDGGCNTEVIGNDIENSSYAGIYSLSQGTNINSVWSQNILNNNYQGMIVGNSTGLIISNNIVNGSQAFGVNVDNSYDLSILSNTFTGNGWNTSLSTTIRYDISITGTVTYSTVQNNVLNSPLVTAAIRVQGINNKILSNTIENGTIGIVANGGANAVVIANNIVNGTSTQGIDIANSVGANVYGNTLTFGGYGGANSKAIYVESSVIQSLVSMNVIDHWGVARTGWGIRVDGIGNTIQGNMILDSASSGQTMKWGIYLYGTGNYVYQNTIYNCSSGKITESIVGGNTFKNNMNYNPVGYIANPINVAGGTVICDAGVNATFVSTTTYTNFGSPKTLYISGGTVTAIIHNAQTLATVATTMTIDLEPLDSFSVTFSAAPTIVVMGK